MNDKRLIEDYIPLEEIGKESTREKYLKRGQIATLHTWWARRPLVACRAAVYASLVPADMHAPGNGDKKRPSLARANAAKFLAALCKYPSNPQKIEEARQNILKAHRQRTGEDGPPKVLDCFSGGGAIPLEALRLGCESHALELNPVAYLILLCTIVYPQKYGKPDPTANWKGLSEEVDKWGKWVSEKVKREVGDLYPLIADPKAPARPLAQRRQQEFGAVGFERRQSELTLVGSYLTPVAYLWTRTVKCKNFQCQGTVPLVRQTWLCKKPGRYIALQLSHGKDGHPRFSLVQSAQRSEDAATSEFGFDPGEFSKGGNAVCPNCGTVVDNAYVKDEGQVGRIGKMLMAVVCTRPGRQGKIYFASDELPTSAWPDDSIICEHIQRVVQETGLTVPSEQIANLPDECYDNTLGITVRPYGLTKFGDLFTPRQLLALLIFVKWVRLTHQEMSKSGYPEELIKAVVTSLAMSVDRLAEDSSTSCRWNPNAEKMQATFGRQALSMVWDFCETNPWGDSVGDWLSLVNLAVNAISSAKEFDSLPATLTRGNAAELPFSNAFFDAVITDPPYYDNVPYSDLSDFFYVWLKRSIGHLYPEHFATDLTPKRNEIIADTYRQGDKEKARQFYEDMMQKSLSEIQRVLKPGGVLTLVYAHKTVKGWETLVEALRGAGLVVGEAWPLETEMGTRLRAMDSSALASSIFITARKEGQQPVGDYNLVRQELEGIVRERVETLWGEGIGGADLLIACVGAGLKAYTKYARIELPNGEEVPAGRFLGEVEGIVQEVLLEKLFHTRAAVSAIDAPTQFYVLWRYFYGRSDLEAGDAIIFSYPLHVELDSSQGLSAGHLSLVEKKGSKYQLKDFADRGDDDELGLKSHFGMAQVPLIDVLHRLLWLVEHRTSMIDDFVTHSAPDTERLRLVAGVLAGSGLQGGMRLTTESETGALQKLIGNWDSLVESGGPLFRQRR
jgi:putative DNA methylase